MKFTNNEPDHKITERLKHRDSSERLLACLESIDDDLIAEAVHAVNHAKLKPPIWKKINAANAAAVFIGVVAVSCILMLAFWLSNIEPMMPPPVDYDENNEYPAVPPLPSPQPGELVPGGILSIPAIHVSHFEIILPAYQQHMTINNPWHEIGHISYLPVFRSHAVTHFVPGQHHSIDIQLTDDEWDAFVSMLHEKGQAIAAAVNISADRVHPEPTISNMFVSIMIDENHSIANKQMGTLSLNTHLPSEFRERISLPRGASLSNYATADEVQAAIEYLAHRLPIPMTAPTITNAEGAMDIGGPRIFHSQRFFDSGGSPEEAILSFNFEWIEILTFDPYHPERIEIALFPHKHFESLQLGHYPIITADEARDMLLEGYFVSSFPDSMWRGRERALNASVELVYHSSIFNDHVEVIMPFYRFLVEVEMPLWQRYQLGDAAGEHRAFARYYVPAVHRDFLEPMTRRQISEPPVAPTGPRALPPDIFAIVHGMGENEDMWLHRPISVNIHNVAELWDEIINDIGELAVGEAYQFRTACGHYALITGNRIFTTRAELHRYFPGYDRHWDGTSMIATPRYPGYDLPETVGNFHLREISVYDQTENVMFIFNRPISRFGHGFMFNNAYDPAPVGEIFTREPVVFSIFAMYENNEGVQVGLGITMPIIGLHFLDPSEDPHSVLDMGEYGLIHFQGYPGQYYRALHEAVIHQQEQDWWRSATIELWFVNGSIDGRQVTWDLGYGPWHGSPQGFRGTHWFTPVEREALEELVRIFNPAALMEEYLWDLMPLQ